MKCARCGREMEKAAAYVGGNPIGPKCWEKMGDKPAKVPRLYLPLLLLADPDQFDLFEDEYGPVRRNDNSASGEG